MCRNIKPAPGRVSFSNTGDSDTLMHLGASKLQQHSWLGLLTDYQLRDMSNMDEGII